MELNEPVVQRNGIAENYVKVSVGQSVRIRRKEQANRVEWIRQLKKD